jgi:excisionase family DNA binding protein
MVGCSPKVFSDCLNAFVFFKKFTKQKFLKMLDTGYHNAIERMEHSFKGHSRMLTMKEASVYLGISISTLYKHTSAKNIAYFKPNGKLILFKKQDLDKWIEAKRIPSNREILLTTNALRA